MHEYMFYKGFGGSLNSSNRGLNMHKLFKFYSIIFWHLWPHMNIATQDTGLITGFIRDGHVDMKQWHWSSCHSDKAIVSLFSNNGPAVSAFQLEIFQLVIFIPYIAKCTISNFPWAWKSLSLLKEWPTKSRIHDESVYWTYIELQWIPYNRLEWTPYFKKNRSKNYKTKCRFQLPINFWETKYGTSSTGYICGYQFINAKYTSSENNLIQYSRENRITKWTTNLAFYSVYKKIQSMTRGLYNFDFDIRDVFTLEILHT